MIHSVTADKDVRICSENSTQACPARSQSWGHSTRVPPSGAAPALQHTHTIQPLLLRTSKCFYKGWGF